MNKKTFTKTALTLSLCLLILWTCLGTGTSVAWFADTTPIEKNSFIIGELDLVVSHKVGDDYEIVDTETELFDAEALYEPGYVQVVYLKIENAGEVDFDYKMSVDVLSVQTGLNEFGRTIYLPDYLKFGVVFGEDEVELDRNLAKSYADIPMNTLNSYSTDKDSLPANSGDDSVHYAALVVYMPEYVGNEANYRGSSIPRVDLGITVLASQKGTLA